MAEETEAAMDDFEAVQEIIIDFGDICRFCLASTDSNVSIHDLCATEEMRKEDADTISNFIANLASIKMETTDNFPSLVCGNCCDIIRICYDFKQTCCQSDLSLRDCYFKTLEQTKSKICSDKAIFKEETDFSTEIDMEEVAVMEKGSNDQYIKVDETYSKSTGTKCSQKIIHWNDDVEKSDMQPPNEINQDDTQEGREKRLRSINSSQTCNKLNINLNTTKADSIRSKYAKINTLSERLKEAQAKLEEDIRRSQDIMSNRISETVYETKTRSPVKGNLRKIIFYECKFCNKKFMHKSRLGKHCRECHNASILMGQMINTGNENPGEVETEDSKQFKCLECSPHRRFDRKDHLVRHLKSLHSKSVEEVNAVYNRESADNFLGGLYTCARCNSETTFATRFSLNRHLTNVHKLNRSEITSKDMKQVRFKREESGDVEKVKEEIIGDCDLQTPKIKLFKLYVCTDCAPPISFSMVNMYLKHKADVHDKNQENISMKELTPVYVDSLNVFEKGDEDCAKSMVWVVCKNCDPPVEFNSAKDFVSHMADFHEDTPNENWDIDSKVLATATEFCEAQLQDAEGKETRREDRVWKCPECPSSYIRKHSLHSHLKYKHDKVLKIGALNCPEPDCGETFFTNRQVIQHGIITHEKYFANHHDVFKTKILLNSSENDRKSKNFECDICSKKYISKTSLKRHILKTHLRGNAEPENAVCPYCGKTLSSKLNLKSHIEFVHEAVYVSCPVCKKNINFKTLGKHYKTHQSDAESGHKVKGRFLCNQCGKVLKSQTSFEDHQKLHNNVRDHICDTCGSGYTNKKNLYIHKKVHEVRKIFNCDQCDKVFHGKHSLNRHLLTHSGEKNFICEMCSKTFYTIQELKRHVRYHKKEYRFDCQLCNMRFLDKSRFRHHMMRHRNVRPHKCHFCDKVFIVKRKMNLHMAARHNVQIDTTRTVWKDPKTYVPLDALL